MLLENKYRAETVCVAVTTITWMNDGWYKLPKMADKLMKT